MILHLKREDRGTRVHTEDRRLSDVREDRRPGCDAPLGHPASSRKLVGLQRSRFDGLVQDDNYDFLAAVAMALTPPGIER